MSELRQRPVTSTGPEVDVAATKPISSNRAKRTRHSDEEESHRISFLDIIRVLVTLVVLSCGLSYWVTASQSLFWGYRPWFTKWPLVVQYFNGPLLLTPEELSLYDGSDPSRPIYLAVNGTIFDVSANPHTYGPGGGYSFFTGRDATRAFVTGCFREDLTPDMTGVEEMYMPLDDPEADRLLTSGEKKIRREQDLRAAKARVEKQVQHWENFFRNHEKYFEVGKVVGRDWEAERKVKKELCEAARKQRPKRKNEKST